MRFGLLARFSLVALVLAACSEPPPPFAPLPDGSARVDGSIDVPPGRRDASTPVEEDGGVVIEEDAGEVPTQCLPGSSMGIPAPEDIVADLALMGYAGEAEQGVVCGDLTCESTETCCATCGEATCTPGIEGCTGGARTIDCDGPEDCTTPGSVCCMTVLGATCRASTSCVFAEPVEGTEPGTYLRQVLDSGTVVCASNEDCVDLPDAVCCTSERLDRVDLGVCLHISVCSL